MIVTESWIKENFNKFNKEYFGGGLPLPIIGLSRSKTQLGTFSCKRALRWNRTKIYDCTIRLTTYYDMTEYQADNVLLHEMIHYSISYTGLHDTSAHGIVFRGMAESINRKGGWKIVAMTTTKGWKVSDAVVEKKKARGPQTYIILALEMQDGRHFLSRINPSFVRKLDRELRKLSEVRQYCWYTTQEPYFEEYPQCRSLRGRRISKKDFQRLINVMKVLSL